MKNIKYTFIASALAAFTLTGCNDLDTEPLGATITSDQKEEVVEANPERIEASVTAMFSVMNKFGLVYTDESVHNDFGYPTVMMWTDSRGMDLVSENTGYNWFTSAATYDDVVSTNRGTILLWSTIYKQLNAVNAVTALINPETEESDLKFYLANAYAIRAFDYFNLAQLYQQTYVGNEDKPCVPLITEENADAAATNGCARATVKEVYAQIMKDLDNAIALFESSDTERADKRYISREVAYGIRARVNLVMHNWTAAANDAQVALEGGHTPYAITDVNHPGFTEIEDNAWMWGVLIAETDRCVTSGICNFPSHMGSLNYGYASVGAWRCINKQLFDAIPDSDVRKGWWLNAEGQSANLNAEQAAYVAEAGCYPYSQMKYGCYKDETGTSTNASDVPLMRAEEMYLILAEATAMAGDAAAGAQILQQFVSTYRDPSYTCTASTPEAVQDAVWMQRRIELWGEGFSYFDMLRLRKDMDRRGAGFAPAETYFIPAGDPALIYRLPQREIEGNPMLEESDNNEVVAKPSPVTE